MMMKTKFFTTACLVTLGVPFTYGLAHYPESAARTPYVMVDAHAHNEADVELLARTMWGEARNQGDEGMEAVCRVILNRQGTKDKWKTIEAVITDPKQFSVWNKHNVNNSKARKVFHNKQYKRALQIARICLYRSHEDITQGATHYHATYVNPSWSRKLEKTVVIGDHIFYKKKRGRT